MKIPKIGQLYKPKNPPASIPMVRKCWGEITDVIKDGHGGYLVEVDYGVEKGDFRNILIENYEQPEEKQNDMNTSNPIQFLDFPTRAKRELVKENEGVIYKRKGKNKGCGVHQLRLPPVCIEALEAEFQYIRIAVNNLTNEVFFVFDKTEGMHVSMKKADKNNNRLVNKPFVMWLEDRFNLPDNGGGVVVFSNNLNRENGYTYKVDPKRD